MHAKKLALPRDGEPSDAALVLAARAGEEWACEMLFRRYVPLANGLAYRTLGRDEEVEDLVQDSFVQALDGLERLQDPQAFASWLSSIVVRTAARVLRRKQLRRRFGLQRNEAPPDVESFLSPTVPPDVAAELRAIYALVDRLPVEERMALVLRRVEGMELEEIGRDMGLSLATVKRRLASAEGALQRAMGTTRPKDKTMTQAAPRGVEP